MIALRARAGAAALATLCAAAVSAAPAVADPAGKSTQQETIRQGTGAHGQTPAISGLQIYRLFQRPVEVDRET